MYIHAFFALFDSPYDPMQSTLGSKDAILGAVFVSFTLIWLLAW